MLKISVITAVYNNKEMIRHALDSVSEQTYKNIEHIIIDGASTDGTKEIIESYSRLPGIFKSEPDGGIYDALNKGVKCATGDIICFLHADDVFANDDVLTQVVQTFETENVDSLYGDLEYVSKEDTTKVIRYWKSGAYTAKRLKWGWMPPHPAFFVKRDVYTQHGLFDTSYKIAADYDFILRVLGLKSISTVYLPAVLYKMRVGGISNRSVKTIIHKSLEDYRALKSNEIGNILTLIYKNLSKVPQFFLR